MSKYDFELDLESNNTMKLINDLIDNSSDVLEFGCACGRLTKYLKEKKNCKVTIVEIDEEAGKRASQFAEKSFLGSNVGDIEKYIWCENLESKFDYIIFADVLEHLYYPEKVLARCKEFLKANGSILVSVPNIAHNSIIIDLIKNKFNYRRTGLLDDTHIRFFTNSSFKEMLKKIKLKAVKEFATYSKVGNNEFDNNYTYVNEHVAKELNKRNMGMVYQYVYQIKDVDSEDIIENNILEYKFCDYMASIFLDCGGEDNKIITLREKYIPKEDKIFSLEFKLQESKFVNKLRFDPIEEKCIVKINNIRTFNSNHEKEIKVESGNMDYQIEDIYFFNDKDPQVYYLVNDIIDKICIEFEFIEYETFNVRNFNVFKQQLESNRILIEQKENYICEQRDIIEKKENYIYEQRDIIEQKENYIRKQRDIIEQKENYILEQRDIIEQKENYICEQKKVMSIINNKLNDMNNELNSIKSSKFYKAYEKMKKVLGRKS